MDSPRFGSGSRHAIPILLGALLVASALAQQGTPSGEYGQLQIGQPVSGTMAPATSEQIVFHTYVVTVPPGTGSLTITVSSSSGADIDLAVRFGAPIVDYNDVDHLDTTEDPSPSYTVANPPPGPIYLDVLNLVQQPAAYRISVTAGGGEGGLPAAPTQTAPGPQNPLGGANPFSPTSTAADPFVGTFEGDGLTVLINGGAGRFQGELILNGQRFPFTASSGGEIMQGSFQSGGRSYPFTATLQGDALVVESDGSRYATRRTGAAPVPAPQPVNPLGGGATAPVAPAADPILAQGAYGTLTRDNAMAFLEALEFSLQQVGYAYAFTEAERQELLAALAQNYPGGQPSDQAVLAQARQVWTQVQSNWAVASEADRRQFIVGVFVIAFGPEAVQQAMGGGGGGGACTDIDTCMATYADPETYQDTINAQSCWAAAGCSDYDPATNDFTYEPTYDPP